MAGMVVSHVDLGYVDKRRALTAGAIADMRDVEAVALFTCNATGTTTTLVGADAAPGTNDNNVVRRGQRFKLFNSSGVLKQEATFTISNVTPAAGTTTVAFTPAAATAPVSGDVARQVDVEAMLDETALDARLTARGYSASTLRIMTQNDKVFAIRSLDDPASM